MFREKIKHFHFVGIGGIGMSGIAQVLLQMGYRVSGSDLKENKNTKMLEGMGARIYIGHREENVDGAQVVVYSSAVGMDNPEIRRAREKNIPVIPRGEMLAELFRLKEGIAVCGSHGKTTTTSMIAHVMHEAGYDPTVVVGGILKSLGSNAKLGKDNLIVSEADESDGSFLKLQPTVSVITNIDKEHLGFYKDLEEIKRAFLEFANSVPFYGFSAINADDLNSKELIPKVSKRVITYGIQEQSQLRAGGLTLEEGYYSFEVFWKDKSLGRVRLGVPGKHNVYNALACMSVCLEMDIPPQLIFDALENFKNAERRLELKGEFHGSPIYDDYGHHPTEIKVVLDSLRELYPEKRIILIFQPHRYSRTYYLFEEFAKVLKLADLCIITDIYSAGEENIYNVSSKALADKAQCLYIPHKEDIFSYIEEHSKDHVLLFMGAGSIGRWSEELLNERSFK
ncbi:UDP-N-acetylmuramate--L-alanine ligase [Thermocrinis sp.]